MIMLNLTLGSRNKFLPESHLLQMIAYCTRRFRSYSPMFSRDLVPVAFAIPYHRYIPMDKYIHLLFLPLFPAALVITRYTENSLYCSENTLWLLPCSSLSPEYPYG